MPRVILSTGTADLNLQQLRERSGQIYEEIKRASAEFSERKAKHDAGEAVELWPGEERAKWDATNKDYDAIRAAVEQEQQAADVAARMGDLDRERRDRAVPPGAGAGDRRAALNEYEQRVRDQSLAFRAWAAAPVPGATVSEETREACQRLRFDPQAQEISLRLFDTGTYRSLQYAAVNSRPENRMTAISGALEQRALSATLGATGGYLVSPGSLVRSLELAMLAYGDMLSVCDVLTSDTADPIFWPVADDTSNEGAYTDENTANTTEANPAFEQVKWGAYDFNSKMVKVPFNLIRDSAFDLESVLGQMLGERLGRKLSGECTTGAAKIRGIVTRSAAGPTTASATAITREEVVALQHDIDPALRTNCRFMFHDIVLEALRLLTDTTTGQPIYQAGFRDGRVDLIEGWPFTINQKMQSTIAASTKTILAGQLSAYKLRRVGTVRLRRLVERYAEYDQIAFIAFMSADGNLLRPSTDASCPVKYLLQHA
jgi:HK97 family phage major capsid protein